jgi:hypothetical protein
MSTISRFGFVRRFADEWNGYLKTSKTFVFHKKELLPGKLER